MPNKLNKLALAIFIGLTCTCVANADSSNSAKSNDSCPGGIEVDLRAKPAKKQQISDADLEFGEQQLQKMLSDRPQLASILHKDDPIWSWSVRQFAGEALNERFSWNPDEISDKGFEYDSDYCGPRPNASAYIRVRKNDENGKPLAASRLLAALVYECFDIRSDAAFDKLNEEALAGRLSKNQYINEGARIQFIAIQKTADFYRNIYLPFAKEQHYDIDPLYWQEDAPTDFTAWRAQYTDEAGYPWSFWGDHYDQSIVPYLETEKKRKNIAP